MTSQRSNESESDERFEMVRSFVIGEDGYVETAVTLEALASIQAELSALREALKRIVETPAEVEFRQGDCAYCDSKAIARTALSGEGERP